MPSSVIPFSSCSKSYMTQQFHYWACTLRKVIIPKDTCTPVFIAALFTIARTWKEPKCPLTEKCKEDKVHIDNGISLSHEKEWNCIIVVIWMNLESVIQSEVSQKEKNKYCILTHIYGIWKNGIMNLFAEKQ